MVDGTCAHCLKSIERFFRASAILQRHLNSNSRLGPMPNYSINPCIHEKILINLLLSARACTLLGRAFFSKMSVTPMIIWFSLSSVSGYQNNNWFFLSHSILLLVAHNLPMMTWSNLRTGLELNWKRLDKMCTVRLVKTALTKEFVTGKVYED